MSKSVKDLINAIAEGDASNIDAAFNSAMAEKISTRLEDMRVQVAQNMFTNPVAEEVEEIEEEQEEVSEESEEIDEESEELSGQTVGLMTFFLLTKPPPAASFDSCFWQ